MVRQQPWSCVPSAEGRSQEGPVLAAELLRAARRLPQGTVGVAGDRRSPCPGQLAYRMQEGSWIFSGSGARRRRAAYLVGDHRRRPVGSARSATSACRSSRCAASDPPDTRHTGSDAARRITRPLTEVHGLKIAFVLYDQNSWLTPISYVEAFFGLEKPGPHLVGIAETAGGCRGHCGRLALPYSVLYAKGGTAAGMPVCQHAQLTIAAGSGSQHNRCSRAPAEVVAVPDWQRAGLGR